MEVAKVRFGGTWRHPDGRRLQHQRRSKGHRDLKFIPTLELDFVLHRNVEAKDGGAGFQRE